MTTRVHPPSAAGLGFAARLTATGMLLAACVLVVGGSVAHGAAAATSAHPVLSQQTIESSVVVVRSSTKHRLRLRVSTYHFAKSVGDGFDVSLAGAHEQHTWGLPAKHAAIKVAADRDGKIVTGNVAPFGKLSLRVTAAGRGTSAQCANTPAMTVAYPVTITGSVSFNTHSTGKHRWGSIHNKHLRFAGSTLLDNYGAAFCIPPLDSACPDRGITYASIYTGLHGVSLEGEQVAGKPARIDLLRSSALKKPIGATRQDDVLGTSATDSIVAHPNGGATLSLKPTSADITGSATLADAAKPDVIACPANATHTSTDWTSATLASHRLTGHAQIFGNLVVTSRTSKNFADIAFQSNN
jgi:hypothetical protein